MALKLSLRKYEPIIHHHLKNATGRRNELQLGNVGSDRSQNILRRTDGSWKIVSLLAVFDRDPSAVRHLALPKDWQ